MMSFFLGVLVGHYVFSDLHRLIRSRYIGCQGQRS